jgi:glycosyltransferase involved in cell wall biosynthesis
MQLDVFFYVCAVITVINITYYIYFLKVGLSQIQESELHLTQPVSVIVYSKNEKENLKSLVPQLLDQDHPNFEIILVNDASNDNTKDIIEYFMALDSRVKMVDVVNIESFWGNKKYALTLGIKKAVNDQLVFINANCTPNSNKWLSIIASLLKEEKSIVLGYGGYQKITGSLLNKLVRFDTGLTAIKYFSYAMHGNPYMGVGRNLAYTATQFYEVSGFMSHIKIMGGDDDLFVNQAATSKNTAVSLNEDSFTTSLPKTSWSQWWRQKKSHIHTATYYKKTHRFLLGLFFSSQWAFILTVILALIFSSGWMFILGIVLLRYIIFWIVVGKGLIRFRESDLIPLLPFLELLLIVSQLSLYISNLIHRPKQRN